jgi:hypothetical protein
MDMKRMV